MQAELEGAEAVDLAPALAGDGNGNGWKQG